MNRRHVSRVRHWRWGAKKSYDRQRRLLRARRERPCRAAEQRDELTPLHLFDEPNHRHRLLRTRRERPRRRAADCANECSPLET
jgi:hypothetical protein